MSVELRPLPGAPMQLTPAQHARIAAVDDRGTGKTVVYSVPPGTVLVFAENARGSTSWIEAVEPEPTVLVAYDMGVDL